LKARVCRQKAAESQAVIDGFQGELYAPQERFKIKQALEEAERWDARAAEARGGYFLARNFEEISDNDFLQEFGRDFTECQQQGRVVYQASVQAHRIHQEAAGATPPTP
jgi:hypothetical protein